MSLALLVVAAFAFGFGARVAEHFVRFVENSFRGLVVALHNRRAAMLRIHQMHCPNCVLPMSYCCTRCGHLEVDQVDPVIEAAKKL